MTDTDLDALADRMILTADALVRYTHDDDAPGVHRLIGDLDLAELRALAVVLAAAGDPWRTITDGLAWRNDPPPVPELTRAVVDEHRTTARVATMEPPKVGVPNRTPRRRPPGRGDAIDYLLVETVCRGTGIDPTTGLRYILNRFEQAEVARYLADHHVPQRAIQQRLGINSRTLAMLAHLDTAETTAA